MLRITHIIQVFVQYHWLILVPQMIIFALNHSSPSDITWISWMIVNCVKTHWNPTNAYEILNDLTISYPIVSDIDISEIDYGE